jgi:hypothetical protein
MKPPRRYTPIGISDTKGIRNSTSTNHTTPQNGHHSRVAQVKRSTIVCGTTANDEAVAEIELLSLSTNGGTGNKFNISKSYDSTKRIADSCRGRQMQHNSMWNEGKRRRRRGDIDGKQNSEFCSARCSFTPKKCHQVALLLAEARFPFHSCWGHAAWRFALNCVGRGTVSAAKMSYSTIGGIGNHAISVKNRLFCMRARCCGRVMFHTIRTRENVWRWNWNHWMQIGEDTADRN